MRKINLIFGMMIIGAYFIFAATDTLTVEKCIKIALNKNPQMKLAQSSIDASSAQLLSARSGLYPQLSFLTSWGRNGGSYFIGPTSREAYFSNYTVGFQGSQMIYDFQRTFDKISAQSDLKEASEKDFFSIKANLILGAQTAYYAYLSAQKLVDVNREFVNQAQEHLRVAVGFFEVGKKPVFDTLKARTDYENACVGLLNAQNNVSISRLQLENILNTKFDGDLYLKDEDATTTAQITEEEAIKDAENNRPEIQAAKLRYEAGKLLVQSAWANHLPTLSATGGYNWRSLAIDQTFLQSWNLGVTFSLPLFQGFAVDAGYQQARANLKNIEAQNDIVYQSIILDVRQQYLNYRLALQRVEASSSLLSQAKETYEIASGRYNEQVGSSVDLTDATVSLLNARVLYIQSIYDLITSRARLEKATGRQSYTE